MKSLFYDFVLFSSSLFILLGDLVFSTFYLHYLLPATFILSEKLNTYINNKNSRGGGGGGGLTVKEMIVMLMDPC